ncbi:MAG: hypothetical protein IK093_03455 [Ruminiclostridium sp.]|nr:hypothetical protein [Ruminiclostridium sp.]
MLVNPMTFNQSDGGVGLPPLEIKAFSSPNTASGYILQNGELTIHTLTSSGLILPDVWDISNNETWEMGSKVELSEGSTNYSPILGHAYSNSTYYACVPSLQYYNDPKHFVLCVPGNRNSWLHLMETEHAYEYDNTYYVKAGWDGSEYYIDVSTDGITWTRDATEVDDTPCYYNSSYRRIAIGTVRGTDQWNTGTIDLTKTYIKINGVVVWGNT